MFFYPAIFYFATSNKDKFLQVVHGSDLRFEQLNVDIPEIQGTQEEIATDKLKKVCELHPDKWIMIDDTSIELKALNGFPGPYGKDFLQILGYDCIENLVSKIGRETTISCVLGLGHHNKKIFKLFTGRMNGRIVTGTKGKVINFDYVLQPDGYDKVFGEMPPDLKNKISHRGLAMKKLRDFVINNKSI